MNVCAKHKIPLDKRTDTCPLCQLKLDLPDMVPEATRARIRQLGAGAHAVAMAVDKSRAELAALGVDYQHSIWIVLDDLKTAAHRLSAIILSQSLVNSHAEDSSGRVDSGDVSAAGNDGAQNGRAETPQ